MENPIMYAIAYKFEEGAWIKFVGDGSVDTLDLDFSCLLPTKEMAIEYISNVLSSDYEVIQVEVEKYHNGMSVFAYKEPKEWN